jgi:hypothetical protein
MNKQNFVYAKGENIPLSPGQLADEANAICRGTPFSCLDFSSFEGRTSGQHCSCKEPGRFNLFPKDDSMVQEGGKRYMRCRICGGISHL